MSSSTTSSSSSSPTSSSSTTSSSSKSVRGAPRATVQQLYGQTYDLEALALSIDAAPIDALDPGGFDRAYAQGKRFAVGDLGRKLLLVVVREKLEVGNAL
ncbi:hypothetical protein, conserved [Eimeria brunetti]|uniref:Uncharacterized protein n=1 Tax=Eimeria brunetti TaxID=51314 RepID=U6LFP9_9EIME|nr:hypothetical protein, conserved [Eimeria brunetti]